MRCLTYFVTSRCDANCRHCFFHSRKFDELMLSEITRLAPSLPRLLSLYISGGEPFLRLDLPELLEILCRYTQPRLVSIPTNGRMCTPEKLKAVCESCRRSRLWLELSLDDIGTAHDENRGVPGLYKTVLSRIEEVREIQREYPALHLGVDLTFTGHNQDHFPEIYATVRNEIRPDFININLCRGLSRDPEATRVDLNLYEAAINNWLHDLANDQITYASGLLGRFLRTNQNRSKETIVQTARQQRMIVPCLAGDVSCVLHPNGDVLPCEMRPDIIGNVRDYAYDWQRLWSDSDRRAIVQTNRANECYCTHECQTTFNLLFSSSQLWRTACAFLS